jgi:hypothetical protein
MAVNTKMVRVLVQLPAESKRALDFIRTDEGIPQAAYLRRLLTNDLRARREAGWVLGRGWVKPPASLWRAAEQREKEAARQERAAARQKLAGGGVS